MMKRSVGAHRWALGALAIVVPLAAGCAPVPRPDVLAQAALVSRGPTADPSRTSAPGAFAHAEKLRAEADAAFDAGDTAGAQLLGERAIAAYAHAHALARVARAEHQGAASTAERDARRAELASLEGDEERASAELDALELRIKVARDAQAVVPSGPADPAREKARREAARALGLEARLLCTAARLLLPPAATGAPSAAEAGSSGAASSPPPGAGPSAPASAGASADPSADLTSAEAAVAKLEGALAAGGPVPIDGAVRARADCLSALSRARRLSTPITRAPGAGDELLAALSATGALAPSRDDRGVFVTLRGVFRNDGLSPDGETRLAELGRVAAAHPDFPVAAVIHQDRESPKEAASWRARADSVVRALKASGAPRVESALAGTAAPLVDPAGRDKARNARVEIVFVTPDIL